MCGILGYKMLNPKPTAVAAQQVLNLFEQLLLESEVRGRHATGVSFCDGNDEEGWKTYSIKKALPAKEFVDKCWNDLQCYIPREMIAHTRYSTSGDWHDNKNNQPLNNRVMSLVHNGLVSMSSKEEFQEAYNVETATGNDSEIILRNILAFSAGSTIQAGIVSAMRVLYDVESPVYACGLLEQDGSIHVWRDHIRPVWFFYHKGLEVVGFASTKDIIVRALNTVAEDWDMVAVWPAEPYYVYTLGRQMESTKVQMSVPRRDLLPLPVDFPSPKVLSQDRLESDPSAVGAIVTGSGRGRGADFDHRAFVRKSFKMYCAAAVGTWEIDPNYPMLRYIFNRFELSKSQQYWACFLYGTFYHPGSVFYVMQEFPEFEKVDLGRLKEWHAANWQKLRYNTDRKYEKGHFVEMFESYLENIGSQKANSQDSFFKPLLTKDPYESFANVTKAILKFNRFGRYSTYIYTEALARCMGMPIAANTMFLKEADSPREGLCIVLGTTELSKGALTLPQWDYLSLQGKLLMEELKHEYPNLGMDYWFMESCLCAYKGFYRSTKGRYLGYYLDRMCDEIRQMQAETITSGISWRVLWDFRKECIIHEYLGELAHPPRLKVDKKLEHMLRDQGIMPGLDVAIRRGIVHEER